MGFGIFKKLKDAFKKAKSWIKDNLPKARKVFEQIKPIVPELTPPKYKNKVKEVLDVVDTGAEAADEFINHNNPKKAIDWAKYEIQPRLKRL